MSNEPLEPNDKELTDAERETLQQIRASGMTTSELLARARRDYENEEQRPRNDPPPGKARDDEDDNAIVTRGELRDMMGPATSSVARGVAQKTVKLAAMEDEIARALGEAEDFKDAQPDEIEAVKGMVAEELGKNPKIRELDQVQLRGLTRTAAENAIETLRTRYRERAGIKVEENADRDARLKGGATGVAGGADTGGRGGTRPAPKPGTNEEVPVEQLCGLGGDFPDRAAIDTEHKRRLREWTAERQAGR